MRRTYRSKKDASGALDHKDVLLTMDEKSSAFDAFYIQNIKHTKREMSSVNFLAAPPSKVRKRKYVKRLIKGPEPQKESVLDSVYLTPNKSLHVNKPLDPFDQLLNSSSTHQNDSLKVNKGSLFGYQNVAKTYKKRVNKLKKYNYSSSDTTDSDKENSDNCRTPDTSNIKKHELLIEKNTKKSPALLDKSIKDLMQNFSLLKRVSPKTPGKLSKPFKFVKNRLTTNMQSPISHNSPLCSTPFKEKYRGESIYNFSPISNIVLNESLDTNTSQNNSIILVSKIKPNSSNKKEISLSAEICKSPVFETPDNYKVPTSSITEDCKENLTTVESNSLCVGSPQMSNVESNNIPKITDNKIVQLQEHSTTNKTIDKSDDKVIPSIEISSLQTTEIEPFIGFSNNEPNLKCDKVDMTKRKESDNIHVRQDSIEELITREGRNIDDVPSSYIKNFDIKNDSDLSHHTNHPIENSVMLFSDDNPTAKDINEESNAFNLQEEENFDNSVMLSEPLEDTDPEIKRPQEESFVENNASFDPEDQSLDEDSDNQSLYDTCDSGNTSQEDYGDESYEDNGAYHCDKLPVVEIERLDDSIILKYYKKMSGCDESSEDSEDYESISNISDLSDKSNESINSENVKESSNSNGFKDISNDNDTDSNSNTEEDRCISFVTTRRRNKVPNDSMILTINDSYGSVSSLECDKTVLSNNRNSNGKADLDDIETLVNKPDSPKIGTISVDITRPNITRLSNIVTRKSARKDVEVKNEYIESKPSIVLQPGKKWERSLSIYRRMTMMNDDNFDHSVLEDEPMQCKGRKYRQSVISTMEMQDKSILHNESLNSRRSTFVSKPCRSTIKIVKEPNNSRISLCATAVFDDLKGFLNEDCDDTVVELSKLSIADSEHEVTVLENFHDSAGRIATARDYVLRRCNQTEVLLFDECYPDTVLKNCHKIGEGVYGEVFLWRARDGRARVMKIVPIAGDTKVNGESQKDFHEIISEIVIAMELSALRAPIAEIDRHFDEGNDVEALDLHAVENATDVFNEVLAVRCVYGAYPSRLLDLWELYDECKGSENDNPAILPVEQQYIVLELANAGQDLESFQFNSAEQAHALLLQVAFALAVGEESFQFEHRDLHWGNVLISPTDQKFATFVIRGRAHRVSRCGVAATIIDYSLSRLSLPLTGEAAALYNDLAQDEGLFDARGDYQFEVYRRMRDKLGNDWKIFEPYTNILWLHYTVDKMITALRYKRTNTKIHKHYIAKLKGIKNRILDYGSAAQFVLTDNEL